MSAVPDLLENPSIFPADEHLPFTRVTPSYLGKEDHTRPLRGRVHHSYLNPQSSSTNVFIQDTELIFELNCQSSSVHVADEIFLDFDLINAAGSTPTLLPSPFLLDRVEVKFGTNLMQTLYPEEIFYQLLLNSTSQELATKLSLYNMSANYGTAAALTASTTYHLGIPIKTVLQQAEVFLPALRGKIQFHCHFASGTAIISTGVAPTGISIANPRIRIDGIRYDPDVRDTLLRRYASADHVSNATVNRQNKVTISPTAIAADQDIYTLMSGIIGTFAYVRFLVRTPGSVQANRYTGLLVKEWSVLDQSGSPVGGYQNIDDKYSRLIMQAKSYPQTDLLSKTNVGYIYELAASVGPRETSVSGVNLGSQYYDGNNRFVVKFPAAVAGGAEVQLMAEEYVNVIQTTNGELDIRYL